MTTTVVASDELRDRGYFVKLCRPLLVRVLLLVRGDRGVGPGKSASVANAVSFNPVGAAIFFEFKHYKPKKRFTSTKCFAFMEMDEIKAGPIVIEL